jgi:hypothetical protein
VWSVLNYIKICIEKIYGQEILYHKVLILFCTITGSSEELEVMLEKGTGYFWGSREQRTCPEEMQKGIRKRTDCRRE